MKKFNITTQKTYTYNGEEKKSYPRVGTLTYFEASEGKSEGYKLELNMHPDTKFYVFEDKPRQEQQATQNFNDMGDASPF